jgi:hypothetical protein
VREKSMENIEKVGNVKLNLTFYKGKDLYSDGLIEDELLEIVKNNPKEKYNEIIFEKSNWAVLYHLSEIRSHVIEWVPITKEDSVLEIGAGCGALTTILSEKSKKVTCIELSKKRSLINANRNKDKDNIEILVGNFQDIEISEKYDYITLIGVFEYAKSYINSERPYEKFLEIIKKYLKPNGKIIIAIENKLGLKYWAGCKEDHTGLYFEGLEGYPKTDVVRTFSKNEIYELLKESGFKNNEFYYPYPDYKLPNAIYSDDYLPKLGELDDNLRNFDADRLVLFNENAVFDSIIRANLFQELSNSFIIISSFEKEEKEKLIFSKYSDSRDNEYKIRTSILIDKRGNKKVEKIPLNKKSINHIEKIYNNYTILKSQYENSDFHLETCRKLDNKIEFDYIEGKTFVEILNEEFDKNGLEAVIERIKELKEKLYKLSNNEKFEISEEFKKVFGSVKLDENKKCIKPANIDFIGTNLIYSNGKFHIIDYEWVFNFYIPIDYIVYRTIFYYQDENVYKNKINLRKILEKLEISVQEEEKYYKMELQFDKYVRSKEYILEKLYTRFKMRKISIEKTLLKVENYRAMVTDKDRHIGNLDKIIEDKEVKITNLDKIVLDKDRHIDNLDKMIVDKDRHIDNLDKIILDKDRHIDNLDKVLESKDKSINGLNERLENILNSKGYKFIRFVRKIMFWRK